MKGHSEFFICQNGVQPSMGEIFVARGKRRRSGAPGMKERRKTVRVNGYCKAKTLCRTELISDQHSSGCRTSFVRKEDKALIIFISRTIFILYFFLL